MAEVELAAATRLRPRPDVLCREVESEAVLLDAARGTYYGLNEVGTRAWSLLAGGATLGETLAALLAAFDAPRERVWRDLLDLARDLVRHELVDVVAP